MSNVMLAVPVHAVVSAAQNIAAPLVVPAGYLLAVGALIGLIALFRPLLTGLLRAGVLALKPYVSLEERLFHRKLSGFFMLKAVARDFDSTQPNLAAELRRFAYRG